MNKIFFRFPGLTLLLILSVSILLPSCNDDNTDPDIQDYSEIKTADWRSKIGQEFEVTGTLIEVEGKARLLVNSSDYYVDALINEADYINIENVSALDNDISYAELFGKKITITGLLKENSDLSAQNSAGLIGDVSLATLEIQDLSALVVSNTGVQIPRPEPFSICIQYPLICEHEFSQENKTALLYSGGVNSYYAYGRYWNDLKFMYTILRQNGYSADNIRVVYANGVCYDDEIPIHYSANPDGLTAAFEYLQSRMNNQTKFFLMMNNHGGGNDTYTRRYENKGVPDVNNDEGGDGFDEQYYYYGNSEPLTDDVLAAKVNSLTMGSMIAVIKPCFSGGLIRDLKGPNRVILTSGTQYQVTYGHDSGLFGEHTYHFFAAVTGRDPISGTAVDADLNDDGKISMYEAQKYCVENDAQDEQPQYEDDNDGSGVYNPSPASPGSNVFL